MDWSAFPFVEYFPSERFPKWEDWKLYYLDVVDVLQMGEDLAMSSMLGLLRGWAMQAVSDLPFRFWLSETGEVVMSLGQYFDIIEERLSISREENCDCTDSIRSRRGVVSEEKAESEKSQAEGRIKYSLNENSDGISELSEVGLDLVATGCSSQVEAMRKFQNVVDLLQLSEEQAEQLSLSMFGEEQVGIKYRYDQRTGQEIIVIPSEWLETNIASTDFKKESFECFDEEACRGKENACNRAEQCKNFDAGKGSEERKLELRVEKQEEQRKRRETLTHVDIESKEQRRLQEENREKFLSKLEKVVTPEGFEYYVDRSSANDKGDDCFFMSDLYFEGSEDDETELPPEFFGFTQETILKDVHLMVPEFLSLVGGGEVDMREMESNQRTFAECLAEDNLRANLIEKIGGVIEEVPCVVERRGCVSSRDEVESFRNKNKIREKSNGSVCSAIGSSGPWQCTDLQTNRTGEICRQDQRSDNPCDLKGEWIKLCAVVNPQGDEVVQELEAELKTRKRAVKNLKDRGVVQSPKNFNRRNRIQVLSRGCQVDSCWETTGVLEVNGSGTSNADYVQGAYNCPSVVSELHPGNSSGEYRLQMLSLARVAEFEWENSSEIPTEGIIVAIPTRERDQLSTFIEVIEGFEVCSVNDTIKTTVHHKGVMVAYRPVSEECQELQRSHNRTLGVENQSCLSRSDLWARLEKNLSRVEDAWPEEEDGGETVPVREKDTPRQSGTHVHNVFLITPILRENLIVLTCHNNRRTAEVPLVENILRALEKFFIKSQKDLRESFSFQWSSQERNLGQQRTARRKRVGFRSQYTKFHKKRLENFESGVRKRNLRGRKCRMEADSRRSEQSAELRGSCCEDLGSPEDLTTNERINGQVSQIRSSSPQLIYSTMVTEKLIATEEFDFRSTPGSEAGNSLGQSEVIDVMTSDRVEDRYVDPQLNTGVEGTEELRRFNEGDIGHSNVWMVERDSDERWFQMGAAISYVSQGQGRRKECYPFSLGYSNDFGIRSEEVDLMPIAGYPTVDSTSDVVYIKRREPQSVADLQYEMMRSMGDVHSRREEFCQTGFCFNGCEDLLSRGTMWLQTSRKEKWSRLKLMKRWCWRRRPPDVRCWSREEMGGHPFKHRRKKDFEEVQSVS